MRLFVAINFSPALQSALAGLLGELRQLPVTVKWVPPENIHLTLKFLGEVAPARVEEIGAALRRAVVGVNPWHLEVKGTGVFPNWRNPRVVWVGVESEKPLYVLQQQVTREYLELGFPADSFTPHLTLGRLRPGTASRPLQDRLQSLAGVSWGRERVTAVSLMESSLTPRGAIYRPVLTVPLLSPGGGPLPGSEGSLGG
ncbi:RNA 2',3'-cyclic phosphodiesterase [Neomoorella mulderi]|uniref:RNA 2',3'-cyclic phosphodiesterase n=1 Tax=Moorella mulderi DSM 14980 TaxID=1122241 RepID=A0A151AUJ9_9FIRM|nr:RNA 2',3'-cyclic phosphodiesterase [Moorella mulderi]KYH31077.1 2',5' RNA ligase family [Moorella mulderi DSM 14980]